MIAVRPFRRWTRNTLLFPESDSVIETIKAGDRCDWAAGSVYEQLGYVVSDCKHRAWYTSNPPTCVRCGLVGIVDDE